jgi:AmmeMemoRadiSam system protein A/AmmeMemoRadiSam system protein B
MASSASFIVFAGIAPHPPIMVPEVGHDAIAEVRGSIDAMAELTRRVIGSRAETVVLVSPHAPLDSRAFVAYREPQLYGDFTNFRAPTATVAADLDEDLLEAIASRARQEKYEILPLRDFELDHGTAVPLYFLQHNGWAGRVVALGYSFLPNEDHLRFGNCIRQAVDSLGRRAAFIASGDLSHRLKPEAPAGYNAEAHLFDEEVVDAIRDSAPDRIINIDQKLRRMAGECGYRSMLVAFGATQEMKLSCEVLNYEAPFGVGYLVAQLSAAGSAALSPSQRAQHAETEESAGSAGLSPSQRAHRAQTRTTEPRATTAVIAADLPALARRIIETFVKEGKIIETPQSPSELLNQRAACFVSIKTLDGDLRGCIGTIEPAKDVLAEELIANAICAATRDPRFPPVAAFELDSLKYSVDVLSPPEPARFEDLDPLVYGVIVEDDRGLRRGLLLPNLEGIDTVAKQVEIASRKAGIPTGAQLKLLRFRAERYSEP